MLNSRMHGVGLIFVSVAVDQHPNVSSVAGGVDGVFGLLRGVAHEVIPGENVPVAPVANQRLRASITGLGFRGAIVQLVPDIDVSRILAGRLQHRAPVSLDVPW